MFKLFISNMDNKKNSLYGLFCPITNELKYVGITTGSLIARLNGHLLKPTNYFMSCWFNELKNSNLIPNIRLIMEFNSHKELLDGEISEIKKQRVNGIKLLNIADGGDINYMLGRTHTLESKEKISKSQKGRKRTKEEKEKQKENFKKLWSNLEWSEKMRKKMLGRKNHLGFKHSDETKKIISDKNKGKKHTNNRLGFKHSDETKKIMSELNKGFNNPMYGKKISPETLKKRSQKVIYNGTYKGSNNPNFKYNIIKDEFIKLYIIDKLSISKIAEYYGCSYVLIIKKINEFKIKREHVRKKYYFNIDDINEHLSKGLTQKKIAEMYDCDSRIINKILKKNKNYE